jgi:hypothetical protein
LVALQYCHAPEAVVNRAGKTNHLLFPKARFKTSTLLRPYPPFPKFCTSTVPEVSNVNQTTRTTKAPTPVTCLVWRSLKTNNPFAALDETDIEDKIMSKYNNLALLHGLVEITS